jgi:sensor histidine kinase YesM
MIDKYIAECSLRRITFTYDVRLFNFRAVEDIDLVTILGNLMDNAISAAEVSVNKTILLETAVRNAFGVLIITNSCDNAPRTNQNRLVTSKREKSLHGFGLKSVRRTLEKYDGEMRWEYEADTCQFITTVMFDKQGLIAFNKP